ncbi:hypothetical protein F5B17DRAFT_301432 [Nemania serpens]|nr:hypothetical protein F5B17DRAFT_301432 [Nemania serpens]
MIAYAMESNCLDNNSRDGDLDGDKNSPHEQQQSGSERSCEDTPADSIYDRPLDQILMSYRKLKVKPCYWTQQHATILHVAYKEQLWRYFFGTPEPETGGSMPQADKSAVEGDELGDTWRRTPNIAPIGRENAASSRVPPFRLPTLPLWYVPVIVHQLITKSKSASYAQRKAALDHLLLGHGGEITPSRKICALPLPTTQPSDMNLITRTKDESCQLASRTVSLSIDYGRTTTTILPESRYYVLTGDGYDELKSEWCLFYLDRSQLVKMPWKNTKRKSNSVVARKPGVVARTEDASATGPHSNRNKSCALNLTQGTLAGIFISIAQARQREVKGNERTAKAPDSPTTNRPLESQSQSQLQPRYQVLLTDINSEARYCDVHLYTAEVSDFLLEHLGTPARMPTTAPSSRDSPLLKIHHAMIHHAPFESFQRRLRFAITECANGTAERLFQK